MNTSNIAGYKFITLSNLEALQESLKNKAASLNLKGTILLSLEGINLSLSGNVPHIELFISFLKEDVRFCDISFHHTSSASPIFKRLKVKIKKEIITLAKPSAIPSEIERAPTVAPKLLKEWLDKNQEVTLLDTRNDYEVRFGTFKNAVHLSINEFSDFPNKISRISKDKPIVMFCTGGIRCEKAALYMLQQGYQNVHQLEGGILGYFNEVGGAHFQGECFVFDERIAVDSDLTKTDTQQCISCQGPIKDSHHACSI